MALSGWSHRVSLAAGRNTTLGTLMERLASIHGDRQLVQEAGGGDLTFRRAADRVAVMAGTVGDRVGPGDRVVLAMPNTYDLWLASLAVSRAGAIPVPLNSELREKEIELVAADAGADWIVRSADELVVPAGPTDPRPAVPADPAAHAHPGVQAAPAVPAAPGDVAAIFYTSGTTGRPKGARLTHRALLGQVGAATLFPSALRHDEAVFGLPLSHIMGFVAALGLAAAGIPVFFLPRFRPDDVLDALEE